MKPFKRVLIVGGGIGGLTLAVALGRQGLKAEVIELKSENTVQGVGIIQPGNALRALRTIGLMEACLSEGFQIDQYVMHEANGEFIARMQLMRIAEPTFPPSTDCRAWHCTAFSPMRPRPRGRGSGSG